MTTAGREVDALVAEHVMGWTDLDMTAAWRQKWSSGYGGFETGIRPDGPLDVIPRYSTDIAAAWLVVEKMRERGYTLELDIEPNETARAVFRDVTAIFGNAEATTAPEAIALAALNALGVEYGRTAGG